MDEIYIVWDMHADSMSGLRTLKSIHKTLNGAMTEIPENIRGMVRTPREPYVRDYAYLAIERVYPLP